MSFICHSMCICAFILLSHLLLSNASNALPKIIKIGGLFTEDQKEQELIFRFAIERINTEINSRSIRPRATLMALVETIEDLDSFHANKKVCSLLRSGVVAIFGPINMGPTSTHTQSICDALLIPHVKTQWDFHLHRDDFSINLYPKTSLLFKAYIDLVNAWNWKTFAIAYESNEGIMRVQDFIKEAQHHEWQILLFEFTPSRPYRDTFLEIDKSNIVNIILDVKRGNMLQVLRHAQQVGMMTKCHSYLVTTLDLHTIDLVDFKFSKASITSLHLIDESSPEIQSFMTDWPLLAYKIGEYDLTQPKHILTESALIYDGVKLLATAIHELDENQSMDITQTISCESGNPWLYGTSLMNYIRPKSFRGISGLIRFDELGLRSKFLLHVKTMSVDGLRKHSNIWREDVSLIVATIINEPYTMLKVSTNNDLTGNDRFEGFAVDLIEELSKLIGFKYEFQLVKDGAYGIKNDRGEWNGMIGELIYGEADMAIADLAITSNREDPVDFTHPFMHSGISILYIKPTAKSTSIFDFLWPFKTYKHSHFAENIGGLYIIYAYISVSIILFIVGRLTPYEWHSTHPCRQKDNVLENNFSLINSFTFTMGTMMRQGSALEPKALSTRTIATMWYFFTIIMISTYTAYLAAYLTFSRASLTYPIRNVVDLSMQSSIEYGCLGSGSTKSFFQESSILRYQRMWQYMKHKPHVFTKTNAEGIARVRKSRGNYAYLMESASIEYIVERDCNLTQIGGLLDYKGYGIATKRGSKYRNLLSLGIIKLKENGVLKQLKERWWKSKRLGTVSFYCAEQFHYVEGLSIDRFGGAFVILLGGVILSVIITIIEYIWKKIKDRIKKHSINNRENDIELGVCDPVSEQIKDVRIENPIRAENSQNFDSQLNPMPSTSLGL